MKIDWGKMISGIIAAILITLQVGLDSKLTEHQDNSQRDVTRIETTTTHSDTIEADNKIINSRLLSLEEEMNSVYKGLEEEKE